MNRLEAAAAFFSELLVTDGLKGPAEGCKISHLGHECVTLANGAIVKYEDLETAMSLEQKAALMKARAERDRQERLEKEARERAKKVFQDFLKICPTVEAAIAALPKVTFISKNGKRQTLPLIGQENGLVMVLDEYRADVYDIDYHSCIEASDLAGVYGTAGSNYIEYNAFDDEIVSITLEE